MKVINELLNIDDKLIGYTAHCPGCDSLHVIWTDYPGHPNWAFNGNSEKPSFTPSLLVRAPGHGDPKQRRCHSHITNGQWQFLQDCSHDLAGKTVDMLPVD